MNRGSFLFREEPHDVIARIFSRSLGVEGGVSARLLDGGMFNTTYLVEYGTPPQWAVLRLGPVERQRLLGFERGLMRAEERVCAVCRSLDLPCSRVLAVDCSRALVDRDYMIVDYIPSVPMCDAGLGRGEKERLYHELGRWLRRLHSVRGEGFGFVSRQLEGLSFPRWSEALSFEIADFTARLESAGGLTAAEGARVRGIYAQNAALFDEISEPRLLHTDMWEGNVLLDGGTHAILAVIDGDRAIFGDPDFEFASPWGQVPPLREGYGFEPVRDERREQRMRLYLAFYLALEAHVGLSEYNNPDLFRDRKRQLFEMLGTFA